MVLAIGADQLGQHLGVARIRLRPRHGMAIAVATHRERIQGIHLIPGGHQPLHQQTAVGFDANHHGLGFRGVRPDQLMDACQAFDPIGDARLVETGSCLVKETHVVVRLRPIDAEVDHVALLLCERDNEPEEHRGALMDQCSGHDIPPAVLSPRQPSGPRSRPGAQRSESKSGHPPAAREQLAPQPSCSPPIRAGEKPSCGGSDCGSQSESEPYAATKRGQSSTWLSPRRTSRLPPGQCLGPCRRAPATACS